MSVDFQLISRPYPLPGEVVPVRFSVSAGSNYVRVWLTDAPRESQWWNRLKLQASTSRLLVFEGESTATWQLELDAGGAYVFTLQEYSVGAAGYGGGYQGSPDSIPIEVSVGTETERRIYVGQKFSQRLGTIGQGAADLVFYVWDDTIVPTTVATHGEVTPALVNPSGPKALAATESATVKASVAALANLTSGDLLPNLQTLCAEMITRIPDHLNNVGGSWHVAPDSTNDTAIERLPTDPGSPAGYLAVARILAERLAAHLANDLGGTGTRWHNSPDFEAPIFAEQPSGANTMRAVWATLANVHRSYEAHRVSSVHAGPDTINTLSTTLDPLLTVHRDFLAATSPLSPAAPATANPAVTQLAQLGFDRL